MRYEAIIFEINLLFKNYLEVFIPLKNYLWIFIRFESIISVKI